MHVVFVASGDLSASSFPRPQRPFDDTAHDLPPTPIDRPAAPACSPRRGGVVVFRDRHRA